ncbi:MAG: hypothetical protein LBN39_02740 [Planctomycetaceae bacterium]|jgi:hypothetical protein|nr:hypothetical protein [Planctomycetaceae bacterium]
MNRFVILEHTTSAGVHWDIMLEAETALTTFSIEPQVLPPEPFQVPFEELPPHRKFYLGYEGEVSGNRGTVRRIDAGTYQELEPAVFRINGRVMSGILAVDGKTAICFSFLPIALR